MAWDLIPSHDFWKPEVKEAKQAEFLIFGAFPWSLVRTIGVIDEKVATRAREVVSNVGHCPDVVVKRTWSICGDGTSRKAGIMIHLTYGDILKHEADALVNTVNCKGVMGRGITLQFRHAFEDNYEAYRKAAKRQAIIPGQMFVFERSTLEQPRWIINFPTERHWKEKSGGG